MGAAQEGDRGSSKQHGKDSAGIGQDKQKAFLASVLESSASLIELSDPKWNQKLKMASMKEALEQLCGLGHPDHPNHNTRYGEILEFQPNKPGEKTKNVIPRKYFHKLISQSDIDEWQGCSGDDESGANPGRGVGASIVTHSTLLCRASSLRSRAELCLQCFWIAFISPPVLKQHKARFVHNCSTCMVSACGLQMQCIC